MMPTMRSPGTAPPFGAKRTGSSPDTPRIGIAPLVVLAVRHAEDQRFRPCAARTSRFPASAARRARRAPPCSRDTSHARRRTRASRRARPPPSPRRPSARASRGSAPCSFSSEYSFLARWKRRSTICRPKPTYCVRTAIRVARRIAARALPVTTTDSHADGGAVCVFDVVISTSSPFEQLRDERRDLAVDLGADRAVADIGVHRIGEIDRGRLARQRDQAPLRA